MVASNMFHDDQTRGTKVNSLIQKRTTNDRICAANFLVSLLEMRTKMQVKVKKTCPFSDEFNLDRVIKPILHKTSVANMVFMNG